MEILSFLAEIFLGRFIIRFLGVNTRYFFLNLFNKSLKRDDLLGHSKKISIQFTDDLYNAIIGFGVLFLIFYVIGLIFFS